MYHGSSVPVPRITLSRKASILRHAVALQRSAGTGVRSARHRARLMCQSGRPPA